MIFHDIYILINILLKTEGAINLDDMNNQDPDETRKKIQTELKCWKKIREIVIKKYLTITDKELQECDNEIGDDLEMHEHHGEI